MKFHTSSTKWRDSAVRATLNQDWLPNNPQLMEAVMPTVIKTREAHDGTGFIQTYDKVFLLSNADLYGYFIIRSRVDDVIYGVEALADDYTYNGAMLPVPGGNWGATTVEGTLKAYWLRSITSENAVANVSSYLGEYSATTVYSTNALRPAVWIPYQEPQAAREPATFTRGEALGHDWWTQYFWNREDYMTCDARCECIRDGCDDTILEPGTVTVTTPNEPTCEKRGIRMHKATFVNPVFEEQIENLFIDPIEGDHDWQVEEWEWDYPDIGNRIITYNEIDTYPEVTLKLKCSKCDDTVGVPVDKPSLELIDEGTLCTGITRSFKAAVLHGSVWYEDTNTFYTLDAQEHEFGDVSCSWGEENATCYARRDCTREGCGHYEDERVNSDREQTVAPTCEGKGEYTYTATFENEAFKRQTTTSEIDPLGHAFGNPSYSWGEENATCYARHDCTREGCEHYEDERVNSDREQTVAPTCEGKGEYTYTATFENEAFKRQTTTSEIDPLGHKPLPEVKENLVEAECETEGGYDLAVYCDTCGDELSRAAHKIPPTGHDWGEWFVEKQPTTAEKGIEKRVCRNNENHIETRELDMLENTDAPETGDGSRVLLWAALVCLSALAAHVLFKVKKKSVIK